MPKYIPPLGAVAAIDKITISKVAGEIIFEKEPVCIQSDGKIYAAAANIGNRLTYIGFIEGGAQEGEVKDVTILGLSKIFSGLTPGQTYYLQDFSFSIIISQTSLNNWRDVGFGEWQSFLATSDLPYMDYVSIYMYFTTGGSWTIILRVYEGEGTGGTLLHQQFTNFSYPSSIQTEITFYLTKRIVLTPNQTYTIFISSFAGATWGYYSGDVYPYGRASFDPNYDFYFKIGKDNKASIGTSPGSNNVKVGIALSDTTIRVSI
jgi:hypothetical protein